MPPGERQKLVIQLS